MAPLWARMLARKKDCTTETEGDSCMGRLDLPEITVTSCTVEMLHDSGYSFSGSTMLKNETQNNKWPRFTHGTPVHNIGAIIECRMFLQSNPGYGRGVKQHYEGVYSFYENPDSPGQHLDY
eukprot:9487129-Pyramimonas_sp.AAC.3